MNHVYHITFCIASSQITFENAADVISEKLMSIKNFIKEKIDNSSNSTQNEINKEVKCFFFKEFGPSESVENISIDSNEFTEFLKVKISSNPELKNEYAFDDLEIRASLIIDNDAIFEEDIWKYDFLDLSKMLESRLQIYGYYSDYSDTIYQGYYDNGDYDTGMIAIQEEVYEGSESDYLKSENPDSFPQDAIFELSTYNL